MNLDTFKVAAISEQCSDAEVKRLFLDLEVASEADIREAVDVLERYRPNIAGGLVKKKPGWVYCE